MSINFLKDECLTITNEGIFGICDNADRATAYIQKDNPGEWIATIVNESAKKIEFRAIDNCVVVLRKDGSQEKSCDALLTYSDNIVFIELKDDRQRWMENGIKQLEATIIHFSVNHDILQYKHRRAFVSNKRHPDFHVIDVEHKIRFRDKHKVRLNVQAKIKV